MRGVLRRLLGGRGEVADDELVQALREQVGGDPSLRAILRLRFERDGVFSETEVAQRADGSLAWGVRGRRGAPFRAVEVSPTPRQQTIDLVAELEALRRIEASVSPRGGQSLVLASADAGVWLDRAAAGEAAFDRLWGLAVLVTETD